MAKKVGIVACKGGVGKTALVVNIGHALVDFGREVLLVDADLHRPNMGVFLGYTNTPKSIHSALSKEHDIETCTYLHPSGLRILPGNAENTKRYNEKHQQELYGLVAEFSDKVEIVLVDTPPGAHHDTVYHGLDAVIGITSADAHATQQLDRTLHHIASLGVQILGVVVNKVGEHEEELSIEDVQQQTSYLVIGNIPYSVALQLAQAHKYPVTFTDVYADVSIACKRIAANLIGEEYVPDVEKESSPVDDVLRIVGLKD